MRVHTEQRDSWPPEYVEEPDIQCTFIRQAAGSLQSTAIEGVGDLPKFSQAQKKRYKFASTPMLPILGRVGGVPPALPGASPTGKGDSPASVIRRANGQTQPNGPTVCVDWLRMRGSWVTRHKAIRLLESFFGESQPGKGRFFLNSGQRFSTGGIFFDEGCEKNSQHTVIEIPGSLLAELESIDLVHQLVYELRAIGCSAIRCDIAIDFRDQPNLIQTIESSCDAGNLTGAKCFDVISGNSGRHKTGYTVNIGKRGSYGSGRFLRVYDKGLQTKTEEPGAWVRWEAELSQDCAQQFIEAFDAADDLYEVCLSHAFGVVDFRDDPGKKLARRERCKWFKDLIGSVQTTRVKLSRTASTMHSKVRWLQRCVAPMLRTIQRVTGNELDRVVEQITGTVKTNQKYLDDVLVRAVCQSMGVQPYQLHDAYRRGDSF